MQRKFIKQLADFKGKTVLILGWVQSIRDQGKIKFLQIRDVTGIIQCVYVKQEESRVREELNLDQILKLSIESV